MKANRSGWRPVPRDEVVAESPQEASLPRARLPESTRCLGCGAVFVRGRWIWGAADGEVAGTLCPACRRISEDLPAGYVALSGKFVASHREELIVRMRHVESREKAGHPLERVMAIARVRDGMLATTTSIHLARAIGEALEDAFEGNLDFQYNDAESLLRVQWCRD